MSPSRDYYADLELPPTADIPDIKKQFRKLALKYHPDRNPGREEEVNSKFQIIQSAHEILTDPQEKAKYDASRGGTSRYPTASGVRGNPWSNVGQQFPTPPRRNQQNARNSTSGAQRWQRFSSGVPPTAKQQASTESEAKKNAAKAFEGMRKGQTQASNRNSQRETRSSAAPPPPPRTEAARQRAQASFGTRKPSQSRTQAPGDEQNFSNSNHFPASGRDRQNAEAGSPKRRTHNPVPDPLKQFRATDEDNSVDGRQRSPYMTHGREKTNPFDGVAPGQWSTASADNPHRQQSPERHPYERSRRSSSVPKPDKMSGQRNTTEASDEERRPRTSTNSNEVPHESHTAQRNPENPPQHHSAAGPSIFNYDDDAFTRQSSDSNRFARSSVDNINTKFTEDKESSKWQFNAGNEARNTSPGIHSGSDSQPQGNSPTKSQSTQRASKSNPDFQSTKSDGSFDADGWSDKLGPQIFVPKPETTTSTSPTRSVRTNSKKVKQTRPTAGNAAVVEETSDEDTFQWPGRKGPIKPPTVDSPQAMDIDSPPPEAADEISKQNDARNIRVEPSRPDWRSGNVDALGTDGNFSQQKEGQHLNPTATGSEDSEEFRASFSDLKNVAPLSQHGDGLRSLDALRNDLPFESKAAGGIPTKLPKAKPLAFPTPPLAPKLPPTVAISGMKPNLPSWTKYLDEFKKYLQEWDDFNAQVVVHFSARKSEINKQRAAKGYEFLGSRGDSDVQDYYSWVQQDNDVRRRWLEACEEHENHFRSFLAFREKMK